VLGETWQDQYKRMQRSYVLLHRAADQNVVDPEIQDEDAARDVLYHFCCDAFHLRDWIQSSMNVDPAVSDDVRHLFRSTANPQRVSTALAACADIANGSKHLTLNNPPYTSGGYAKVTSQSQGAMFPATFPINFGANQWKIDVGGFEHDALNLAAQAVADWDTWLTGHRLLPLPT
jgi:hypothetical protein